MAVERYGSKTDVVVKLVLVFFIALLSFSIGTFVGKKFSDNQHKLAQLESDGHDATASADGHNEEHGETRGVASVSPDAGEVKPEKALTDDEIAKLAEEFVTDDEHGADPHKMNDKNEGHAQSAKNEDPHAAPAAHPPADHKPASTHAPAPAHVAPGPKAAPSHEPLKPAARMTEGESPIVENPAKPVSRIPSSLPKEVASSAIGKYTVQVGSYQTEKEAQTVAADLKGKGFSAFYVAADVKGKKWHRVSVGLFTTSREADAYKKDLLARAKVNSAIVQKIQ